MGGGNGEDILMELKLDENSKKEIIQHIKVGLLRDISTSFNDEIKKFQLDITKVMSTYLDDVLNFSEKILKNLPDKNEKLSNLKVIFKEIETEDKIDAEKWVEDYFKEKKYHIRSSLHLKVRDEIYDVSYVPEFLKELNETNSSGRPDFVCFPTMFDEIYSNRPFMIEVKTNGDGLRANQAKWIKDNPSINVVVFYLIQKIKPKKQLNPKQTKQPLKEDKNAK